MSQPTRYHRRLIIASLCLGVAACGFGHSIERPNASTLVENLGANRYNYQLTRLVQAPPRGPAAPVVGVAPAGARELGMIEVTAEYSGAGTSGLRDSEAEFHETLGKLAGEMGGSHFLVLRSTRENRLGVWLSSLTVDVLDVPASASQ
jgi:hypothetical protein